MEDMKLLAIPLTYKETMSYIKAHPYYRLPSAEEIKKLSDETKKAINIHSVWIEGIGSQLHHPVCSTDGSTATAHNLFKNRVVLIKTTVDTKTDEEAIKNIAIRVLVLMVLGLAITLISVTKKSSEFEDLQNKIIEQMKGTK